MSARETTGRTASRESSGDELTPAELAARVATLTNGDTTMRSGDLPMWDRLEKPRTAWWTPLFWLSLWCVSLGLLAVALLRVYFHDGLVLLTWLNAFTWYVYLPVYGVLALAAWGRRWSLATVSAVVAAFHLAWVVPDFRPPTPYAAPPGIAQRASDPLRIFYANVWSYNSNDQALIDEVAELDPDVIVLVEYLPRKGVALRASPVMRPYVHGTNLAAQYAGEIAVLSKLPVRRQQLAYVAGQIVNIVDLDTGEQTLRLFCIHGPRPLMEVPGQYPAFWREIEPLLARQPEPLVVIGDFNATQNSAVLERLTSGRLRSAHVDRGRGYAVTWPNGQWLVPPIRIDHALVSPQVECLAIAEGEGGGSDHKPLVLDLRVHGSSESPAGTAAEPYAVRPDRATPSGRPSLRRTGVTP